MLINFEQKGKINYEVEDERVEEIFEDVAQQINAIMEKYSESERDLIIATCSFESISHRLNQKLSDEFGADEVIKILGAIEAPSTEEEQLPGQLVFPNQLEKWQPMKWNKIDLDDESTFPELGKRVFWCRTGHGREVPYQIHAALYSTDYGYSADGTYLSNEDYWFDIPELDVAVFKGGPND